MTHSGTSDIFTDWLSALEARHLADLRVPEVTRALRALSSAYVERRHKVAGGSTLDSAGKRAAFALFYAPLHFLATQHVVRALDSGSPAPSLIVDLGCGTGAAGAAWAIEAGSKPSILGIDRHPWAVSEARWTYRCLGLRGQSRQADASRLPPLRPGVAIVGAYVLNEMSEASRETLEHRLLEAAKTGARVLVLEPIARSVTPWWDRSAERFRAAGGRADEWKFAIELPPLLRTLDAAAGLNHREL
ncbi:MAG TPA: methyltransferase domain-containing protein, partial [Vicinamibacterales bacterium]|nr:methyltransferase domain-containing protein [Vicinamibacterales bacterium]